MVFADSHRFSLIFIGFGGFEALEVRGPGAAWGSLGQPGAAWGSLGRPGAAWGGLGQRDTYPYSKSLQITGCLGTSGWMPGHWAPRG